MTSLKVYSALKAVCTLAALASKERRDVCSPLIAIEKEPQRGNRPDSAPAVADVETTTEAEEDTMGGTSPLALAKVTYSTVGVAELHNVVVTVVPVLAVLVRLVKPVIVTAPYPKRLNCALSPVTPVMVSVLLKLLVVTPPKVKVTLPVSELH